jgi:hypothetical protein
MTERRSRLTEQGYPNDQIETGEIHKQSPITGDLYRVTKWVDKGDGRIVALEKELVDDG